MSATQVENLVFRTGAKFIGSMGQRIEIKDVSCQMNNFEGEWQAVIKFAYETTDGKTGVMEKPMMPFVDMMSRINAYADPSMTGIQVTETAQTPPPIDTHVPEAVTPGTIIKLTGDDVIATKFRQYADGWGLRGEDLGKAVSIPAGSGHKIVRIIGAKPRNYKMPIIVEGTQGGRYKVKVETVKKALGYK